MLNYKTYNLFKHYKYKIIFFPRKKENNFVIYNSNSSNIKKVDS